MLKGFVSVERGHYFTLFEGDSDLRSKGWEIVDWSEIRGFIITRTVFRHHH
jgi:hypothetical protein